MQLAADLGRRTIDNTGWMPASMFVLFSKYFILLLHSHFLFFIGQATKLQEKGIDVFTESVYNFLYMTKQCFPMHDEEKVHKYIYLIQLKRFARNLKSL